MLRAGAGTHTEHCSGFSRRLWQLMLRAEAGTHTLSTVVNSVEDCGFKIHNVDACACLKIGATLTGFFLEHSRIPNNATLANFQKAFFHNVILYFLI